MDFYNYNQTTGEFLGPSMKSGEMKTHKYEQFHIYVFKNNHTVEKQCHPVIPVSNWSEKAVSVYLC